MVIHCADYGRLTRLQLRGYLAGCVYSSFRSYPTPTVASVLHRHIFQSLARSRMHPLWSRFTLSLHTECPRMTLSDCYVDNVRYARRNVYETNRGSTQRDLQTVVRQTFRLVRLQQAIDLCRNPLTFVILGRNERSEAQTLGSMPERKTSRAMRWRFPDRGVAPVVSCHPCTPSTVPHLVSRSGMDPRVAFRFAPLARG